MIQFTTPKNLETFFSTVYVVCNISVFNHCIMSCKIIYAVCMVIKQYTHYLHCAKSTCLWNISLFNQLKFSFPFISLAFKWCIIHDYGGYNSLNWTKGHKMMILAQNVYLMLLVTWLCLSNQNGEHTWTHSWAFHSPS